MGMEAPRKKTEAPAEEPAAPESVQSAALKYGDEVFTGTTIDEAQMALESAHPDFEQQDTSFQSGFVTNDGRFVDRKEAFDILIRGGELKNQAQAE